VKNYTTNTQRFIESLEKSREERGRKLTNSINSLFTNNIQTRLNNHHKLLEFNQSKFCESEKFHLCLQKICFDFVVVKLLKRRNQ
jgi:hypothetical protein